MKENKTNRLILTICRWFVGLVFLFSSFVKGVDPMGTSYKIHEYMTAWSVGSFTFEWATPMATFLAFCLIALEFTVGVMLITGSLRKLTAWVLTAMMIFFTATTLIDAVTNKVTDCGCFGDFLKLTNWQTFWKNVVLDVPTVFILLCNKWKTKRKRLEQDTLIAILAALAMVLFGLWNVKNEPCLDFRAWKVGNQMIPFGEDLEVKSYLTYRDKASGKTEEFESEKLMEYLAADSNWMDNHEFVDSRVVDPYEIKADGFSMLAPDQEDYAKDIIGNANYVLIGTIHHIDKVDAKGINALRMTHNYCVENGINFVILTAALPEEIQNFLHENKMDEITYFFADDKAIETMLRSNPGFILLKDAKVLGKWSLANAQKIQKYPFQED